VQDGDIYRLALDGEADAMISQGLLAGLSQAIHQMDVDRFLSLDPSKVADLLGLRDALTTTG
jgi:sulfur transfer protein SufE